MNPGIDLNRTDLSSSIEPGIRPLCDALNGLPDTYTLWSCEGHSERAAKPYVIFITPQDIAFDLYRLIECSPCLKFNWVLTAGFREDGSLQYTLCPSDIRLTRQGFSWWPRKRWSHEQMCAELLRLAQLVARRSVFSDKESQKSRNTVIPVLQNSSELFYSSPTSSAALLNSKFADGINSLITQIQSEVEDVQEIIWWTYRVLPHDCIACDIYGSDKSKSLNLNITIAGDTAIPSTPHEDCFELQDATDAFCLLALIVEKFQLKHVKSVPQGLQFSLREIER